MGDIVEDLKDAIKCGKNGAMLRAGTADSDVNSVLVPVPHYLLQRTIDEVLRLRSLAGPISNGPSFREATEGVSRRSVEPESPS